jgi:hypothetical protein
MSSLVITEPLTEGAPQVKARIAGVLYLIIIVGGIFAQIFVRDRLVVSGDAAATANNIVAHELLYRLGFAAEVFYLLCGIPLKLFLYDLFKVVNGKLAVVMVLFAAVGAAIQGVILLGHYAPLVFLGKGAYLSVFTPAQLQAAAYVSLRLFDNGYMIALAFFGCFCVTIGYLIVRSSFFPRIIGVLLAIEGTLYLTNSFAHFVSPAVGARVFPFLAMSGLGEVSFCLCLLVLGVNARRWREQASRLEHA